MSKYVFFLLILFTSLAWSQNYYLKVLLKDGTSASIALEDIQKITFSGTVDVGQKDADNVQKIVNTFMLFQNYPNPFNPVTTIEYKLPRSGRVEIRIFNVTGQLIKSMDFKSQEPGAHKIEWNGKDNRGRVVSSGLYLYQVKFEDFILLKKMMFVK